MVHHVIDTLTTRIVAQEYGMDERLPSGLLSQEDQPLRGRSR